MIQVIETHIHVHFIDILFIMEQGLVTSALFPIIVVKKRIQLNVFFLTNLSQTVVL